MTDRRDGESIVDWLARSESDAEDLGRSAQAEDDTTTTLIAIGRMQAYRRTLEALGEDARYGASSPQLANEASDSASS